MGHNDQEGAEFTNCGLQKVDLAEETLVLLLLILSEVKLRSVESKSQGMAKGKVPDGASALLLKLYSNIGMVRSPNL